MGWPITTHVCWSALPKCLRILSSHRGGLPVSSFGRTPKSTFGSLTPAGYSQYQDATKDDLMKQKGFPKSNFGNLQYDFCSQSWNMWTLLEHFYLYHFLYSTKKLVTTVLSFAKVPPDLFTIMYLNEPDATV